MPTGDIVATRLREQGYDCCLILLTGDSSEQLDQYKNLYQGYLIDLVLDKHHLPSYVHIFENYTEWVCSKLPFGKLLLRSMGPETTQSDEEAKEDATNSDEDARCVNKVHELHLIFEHTRTELKLVETKVQMFRECVPKEALWNKETKEALKKEALDPLLHALVKLLPWLKLCKIDCLCDIIDSVCADPETALANALVAKDERPSVSEVAAYSNVKAPTLLSKLAREITLMHLILCMAIDLLEESLKASTQVPIGRGRDAEGSLRTTGGNESSSSSSGASVGFDAGG